MTVFLTTHYMEEAAEADQVVVIDHGRQIASGTPHELKQKYAYYYLNIYHVKEEDIKSLGHPYTYNKDHYTIRVNHPGVVKEMILQKPELFNDFECENEKKSIKEKNPYFIIVQKELVDMLIKKKLNFYLVEKEVKDFYDLLYTPFSMNPLRVSYNFLMANDVLEVDRYFKKEMKDNVKVILPKEKHFLNAKAYEILNYSFDQVKDLDSADVDKINSQVYDYFKIRENAINKEYLLEKALETLERENNKVTSGNGYVDILLIMSIICTVLMVIGIVVFILI